MTEIEVIKPTDLVRAARNAYAEADAKHNSERDQEHGLQIIRIREQLAKLGIEPAGDPFTNRASGNVCVPVVRGGWDEEGETYVHGVAVEWAVTGMGLPLVADLEPDEGWSPVWLYPAGRLTGLADVGRAIADGGRVSRPPQTAADRVRRAIGSVTVDYAGPNAEAILAAADAVCEAILDVAEAIREASS